MNFNVHWVSNKLIELNVDEVSTGVMDKNEALELAKELINVASELLSVEETKKG